ARGLAGVVHAVVHGVDAGAGGGRGGHVGVSLLGAPVAVPVRVTHFTGCALRGVKWARARLARPDGDGRQARCRARVSLTAATICGTRSPGRARGSMVRRGVYRTRLARPSS